MKVLDGGMLSLKALGQNFFHASLLDSVGAGERWHSLVSNCPPASASVFTSPSSLYLSCSYYLLLSLIDINHWI